MSDPTPFHRFFGLSWIDFFDGTGVEVKTEVDLSLKQQFIDLVIICRNSDAIPRQLPDGFEELVAHNLITFKSYQEALDEWAILELAGHYVNYRKQASPSLKNLLSSSEFQLFAVCARFPEQLAREVMLTPVQPGVYEIALLTRRIRIVVVNELPHEQRNAMLLLFSARKEQISYARQHYRQQSSETSTLLRDLIKTYNEDPEMADQRLKDYARESNERFLASLTPEDLLKRLTPEDMLKKLTPEDMLKKLTPEQRLQGLSTEQRLEGLTPDELLRIMSPEDREALMRKLNQSESPKQSE